MIAVTTLKIPFMDVVKTNHKTKEQISLEYEEIKAAQKNPAHFEVLYDRYYEQILLYIYQRVDSKDIAFDITQQAFMKALANIKKYKNKGVPFSAWLYRIASNELNSFFKKNKSQQCVNAESTQIYNIAQEIEEESLDDMYNVLVQAIGSLAQDEIDLIQMRYFENRAFKEIAQILSITENNAKVKVYRIIDKLKIQVKNIAL